MKPGVVLINTARGALVDEAALIEGLRSGRIRHAGLDVFHAEPLKADHPLAGMDNVTLSAHAGFRTLEASQTLLRRAIDIVRGYPGRCRRWHKRPADAINTCVTPRCRTLMERYLDISLRVNGEDVRERVEARKTLVDFLRDDLGLTGSHIGCEQGVCGACTVLHRRRGGARLPRARGAMRRRRGRDHRGHVRFRRHRRPAGRVPAAQCAAMRLLHPWHADRRQDLSGLLGRGGVPSRDAIREHLAGNYCRCTGYQAIVDAIESVAQTRAGKAG